MKLIHNLNHLEQYKLTSKDQETWSRPERNRFIDGVIASIVSGNRVVETGCRSGLFCYSSVIHKCEHVVGFDIDPQLFCYSSVIHKCEHVVGFDIDPQCIERCQNTFRELKVNPDKYAFVTYNAEWFDYSGFDVVLCLGLLYNINDVAKENVLHKIKNAPISLIEFWCIEDDNPQPHTTVYNQIQFMPNQVQAELFLKQAGLVFEDITPFEFQGYGHDNRYYLCSPLKLF